MKINLRYKICHFLGGFVVCKGRGGVGLYRNRTSIKDAVSPATVQH